MRGGSLKDVLCYRANPLQRCSVKYACQVSHVPGQSTHLDDRGLFMAVGSVATHALSCGEAAGKTTTSSQTRSTNIVCIRVQAAPFFLTGRCLGTVRCQSRDGKGADPLNEKNIALFGKQILEVSQTAQLGLSAISRFYVN